MKCLRKFKWIKVRRNYLPIGKGIMAYWSRMAARAAFRKGKGCIAVILIKLHLVCGPEEL